MPTIKASNIIRRALRVVGRVAPGEPVQPEDAQDALEVLNAMLSQWRTQSMTIAYTGISTYALVGSQGDYTLGPGGDFDQPRPTFIKAAGLVFTNQSPELELPLEILTAQLWQQVTIKEQTSTFPTKVWAQMTYPLITLHFWPVPRQSNDIRIYYLGHLESFSSQNADYDIPDGYEDAMVYQLAKRLAPEYGTSLSPEAAALAIESLARIKAVNQNMTALLVDRQLQVPNPPIYDWRTDQGGGS